MNAIFHSRLKIWFGLVLAFSFLVACTAQVEQPAEPDSVTLQLSWLHYGAFGGFYAADQNGLYADENLTVSFLEGGPAYDPVEAVLAGDAEFGVASADTLVLARANGKPVRAVATVLRTSPAVLITLGDSGITHPKDLVGKEVRMTTQIAPSFHAMMASVGIPPEDYLEVVLPSELDLFVSGEVPVWGVYYNSFAVAIQEAGYELNFIFPQDFGVRAYGDVIFTTDALIEDDPDLVTRFLRASLAGWQFAIEEPEAIGEMVTQYDDTADAQLESAKMEASIPLIHTGRDYIGWMQMEHWQMLVETLRQEDILSAPLTVDDVFTMTFLHDIYGEQ